MKYSYRAADVTGAIQSGVTEANSREEVILNLKNQGKFPLEIKQQQLQIRSQFAQKKLSLPELLNFTRQLAGLLSAEIPLEKALGILTKLNFTGNLSRIIKKLERSLQEGISFTGALEQHSDSFSEFYISLVRAGEAGGILPKVLGKLADYLNEELKLKRFITSSLFYPALIIAASLGAFFFFIGVVLPKFAVIFDDLDGELPLITQVIMTTSKFLQEYWFLIIGFLVLGVFWLLKEIATARGRFRLDGLMLRLPLIGSVLQKIATSRLTYTLSLLNTSGVPLLNSIEIAAQTVGNAVMKAALKEIGLAVKQGNTFAGSMRSQGIFPVLAVEMITVGEESGNLSPMLEQVAKTYEAEVRHALNLFISVLEPLIILLLVGGIALMAAAIILPIMNINQLLG